LTVYAGHPGYMDCLCFHKAILTLNFVEIMEK
jgi:hypothetical protein